MEIGSEFEVTLPYDTPVVGCEIKPFVRSRRSDGPPLSSLSFSWCRQISCSVHQDKKAVLECNICLKSNVPPEQRFHCSSSCFLNAWENHVALHGGFAADEDLVVFEEGNTWIQVGSSKTYEPSADVAGFKLRLECRASNYTTGVLKLKTEIVIPFPIPHRRTMIQLESFENAGNINFVDRNIDDFTFRVLSYNILSDIFSRASTYCPRYALDWEYRKKNLLREMISYDADILCLQEVQSDHFENFFKPKLAEQGYSVVYKRKTMEMFTENGYISEGCATFFRHSIFREIKRFEINFDAMADSLIEQLGPELDSHDRFRIGKGNVATIVIFEVFIEGRFHNPRICVANTHITADRTLPYVKFFQISNLVHELENIASSQVPVLMCGDLNSCPGSDAHTFLVRGSIDSLTEDDPYKISKFLKFHHGLPLVSAYAALLDTDRVEQSSKMDSENREPLFTRITPRSSKTLDYIFYTEDSLKVDGLLELLEGKSLGNGLPSPLWSSDHIALMARFRLKLSSY